MVDKDTKKLVKALKAQGFTVEPTTKGHQMVTKDGTFVTVLAGTGSDRRGQRNAIAAARRHGFTWPPSR